MNNEGIGHKPWHKHRALGRSSKEIFEAAMEKRFMDEVGDVVDSAVADWIKHLDSQRPLTEQDIVQLVDKISIPMSFNAHKDFYDAVLFYCLAVIEKFLNRALTMEEETLISKRLKAKLLE